MVIGADDLDPDVARRLLGVDASADAATIQGAFRRRARELHPDHNPAPDAEARFLAVSAARHVLLDVADRRERLIETLRRRPGATAPAGPATAGREGAAPPAAPAVPGGFFRGEVDPDTVVAPIGEVCFTAQVAPVRDPRAPRLTPSGHALLYGPARHGELIVLDADAGVLAAGGAFALRYYDGTVAWRAIAVVQRLQPLVGGRTRAEARVIAQPVRLDPRQTGRRAVDLDVEAYLSTAPGAPGDRSVPARVFDVSPTGVGVESPAPLAVGEEITLTGHGIAPARFAVVRSIDGGTARRFGAAATDERSTAFFREVAARSSERRFGSARPTPLTGPGAPGSGFHSRRSRGRPSM